MTSVWTSSGNTFLAHGFRSPGLIPTQSLRFVYIADQYRRDGIILLEGESSAYKDDGTPDDHRGATT